MSIDKHLAEFIEALNGGKGEFDAWLECNNEKECREAIRSILSNQAEEYELRIRVLEAERIQQYDPFTAAVPPSGHPLQKLGYYLSRLLDEDRWATAEQHLLATWAERIEAQRVPEGWKLVPIYPTSDMLSAFDHCDAQGCQFAETYWDAMLAVAPAPKEGE